MHGKQRVTLRCLYVQAYGGYLATLLLSSDFPHLKCGAAVSPITDFELYGMNFSNTLLLPVSLFSL